MTSKDDDDAKESDEDFIGMAGNLSYPKGSSSQLSFRGEWHYNASKQDYERSIAATSNSSAAAASLEPVDVYKSFPFLYTCEQISRMWHPACVGYGFNKTPTEHVPKLEAETIAGTYVGPNTQDIDTSRISPIYLGVNAQRFCNVGSAKDEGRAKKTEPLSPAQKPHSTTQIPATAVAALSTPSADTALATTPAIAPTPATTPAIAPAINPRTPVHRETSAQFSEHPLSQLFDSRAPTADMGWKHPPFIGLWSGEFTLVPDAKSPSASNHKKQKKKGKAKSKPKHMQIKEKFALYSSGPNPHDTTTGHGKNKFGNFLITTRWDGSNALTCEKVYMISNKPEKNTAKTSRSPLFLAPPKALRKPSWQESNQRKRSRAVSCLTVNVEAADLKQPQASAPPKSTARRSSSRKRTNRYWGQLDAYDSDEEEEEEEPPPRQKRKHSTVFRKPGTPRNSATAARLTAAKTAALNPRASKGVSTPKISGKKPMAAAPAEHCDVCLSSATSVSASQHLPDNEILMCSDCKVSVHRKCYGLQTLPDDVDAWLCDWCACDTKSKGKPSCVLCPNTRGAVKRTTLPGKWAHIACAYWLNDVGFLNPTTLQPICSIVDGQKGCISSVLPGTPENQRYLAHLESKQKAAGKQHRLPRGVSFKARCNICESNQGVVMSCSYAYPGSSKQDSLNPHRERRKCETVFHPLCARRAGLYMERVVRTDADAGKGPGTLPPFGSGRLGVRGGLSIIFCAKHGSNACRLQYRQQQEMLSSSPLPALTTPKGAGRPARETSDSTGELEWCPAEWVDGKNGDVYEGQKKDGVPHGYGVQIQASSEIMFEGQWKEGRPNGWGIISDKYHRIIYAGEFLDGQFHGTGTYFNKNGDIYDGDWKENSCHGKGTYTCARGSKYSGQWRDNKRHGRGEFDHYCGVSYSGEWRMDERHGRGILTSERGFCYEGVFKMNEMEGKGVCVYPEHDGTKFEGTFRHGLKEGRGTFTFNNGAVYEGHFRHDTLDGRSTGTFTLPRTFKCTNPSRAESKKKKDKKDNKDDKDNVWMIPILFQSDLKQVHLKAGFTDQGE